jgi:DMSO reductase anchor subunit
MYTIWMGHAEMKTDMAEKRLHAILDQVSLVHGIIFLYYFVHPLSSLTYLMYLIFFLLRGMWLITAILNQSDGYVTFLMADVVAIFPLEVIFCLGIALIDIVSVWEEGNNANTEEQIEKQDQETPTITTTAINENEESDSLLV